MRWFIALASALMVIGGIDSATASQNPTQAPGLERAVARLWTIPMVITEEAVLTEYNDLGTPISETTSVRTTNAEGTPIARPPLAMETGSGLVYLAVVVFEYDTPVNAAAGYAEIARQMTETTANLPEFADAPVTTLDAGDEATAVFALGEQDGVPLSFAFANVLDDRYIYQVQGQFARLDAEVETMAIVAALTRGVTSEGEDMFDPAGGSTGGLWDKFAGLTPTAFNGTTVVDAELYPAPSPSVVPPDATPDGG